MRASIALLIPLVGAAFGRDGWAADCSIFKEPVMVMGETTCQQGAALTTFFFDGMDSGDLPKPEKSMDILDFAFDAFSVMQDKFWSHRYGWWPTAIDWTAAFIQTAHSGMTATLSASLAGLETEDLKEDMVENMINSHFAESVAFYFGQHDKDLRYQAHDDMLWVVLGWLEATNFIRSHSIFRHWKMFPEISTLSGGVEKGLRSQVWHGNSWVETFARRQTAFWGYASAGWDERWCGGGMNWDPKQLLYKNAITNELWIAASAKLFLDYPIRDTSGGNEKFHGRNRTFLHAAVKGYEWMMNSNMTNDKGLFVDGYHVSKLEEGGTVCDERNEAVYTYNQGVILTGQRALWDATGMLRFLTDGHRLIQNTIKATGWDLRQNKALTDMSEHGKLPRWHGIGRGGIMEERCDVGGYCSQNSQTFKGIYFHHLAYFCRPLVETLRDVDQGSWIGVKRAHAKACTRYLKWVEHNVEAALMTRDSHGVFGQWWGAEKFYGPEDSGFGLEPQQDVPGAVDYRNDGIPSDPIWTNGSEPYILPGTNLNVPEQQPVTDEPSPHGSRSTLFRSRAGSSQRRLGGDVRADRKDANKRGRGRTVETQSTGMSLLRCWWELTQAYSLPGTVEKNSHDWVFGGLYWLFTKLWFFFAFMH